MPRRGAIALLLTTAALALLLSFKTPTADPAATGEVALAPAATPTPAASSDAGATAVPSATPEATPTPTGNTATAYRDGTVTGSAVQIRWGTVQVQVTISDGFITDVTALDLPTGDHHSLDISQRVEPVLRTSALEAQSADITILSGATYTSRAYAQSLQSALDAARA
jgi:uncharacterized protein with FMN-binding domain